MKGLRLVDLYPSIQGEGPRTGFPTMFVRFGGCNMRCPGWPCDTPYAIEPSLWRNDPIVTVEQLFERMAELPSVRNYCITGGEPFMQPEQALEEFANQLTLSGKTIDIFTNGSLKMFPLWTAEKHVSIIMDWKLKGSGESNTGTAVRESNIKKLGLKDWVKFVIASEEDFEEAIYVWQSFRGRTLASFTAGTAWHTLSEKELADRIIDRHLPWKLNVQVHKYIYDPMGRQI